MTPPPRPRLDALRAFVETQGPGWALMTPDCARWVRGHGRVPILVTAHADGEHPFSARSARPPSPRRAPRWGDTPQEALDALLWDFFRGRIVVDSVLVRRPPKAFVGAQGHDPQHKPLIVRPAPGQPLHLDPQTGAMWVEWRGVRISAQPAPPRQPQDEASPKPRRASRHATRTSAREPQAPRGGSFWS